MILRKCGHCKCETNALLRLCCNKGKQEDLKSAFDRDMEERMKSDEFAKEYKLSQEEIETTQWEEDCLIWWKKVLTGDNAHWCPNWDFLPIDETCDEFECCVCYRKNIITHEEPSNDQEH